jgi:hypothetical protein
MMNEQCWVLVGGIDGDLWWGKKVRPHEGSPASVAFDPNYAMKRDEQYGDVVGFIHTHPSFTAHYSMRDDRTMKAWVLSLGKPLVCCILGTDGLRAWWYLNDEDPPVEYQAKGLRGIVFGMTPEEFVNEKEENEEFEFLEEEIIAVRPTGDGADATCPIVESECESNQV